MKRLIPVLVVVVGGLAACEKTEYVEQVDAGVQEDASFQEDAAPCGPDTYPCPPYGAGPGSVIDDVTFAGWIDDNGDGDILNDPYRAWGMDYFYQLGLANQADYLVLNGSAGWCTYCRKENAVLPQLVADYQGSRIVFAEFVFQDNAGNPATKAFVEGWVRSYNLPIPVGVDASFKMGRYFDATSSPANLYIALRDLTFYDVPIKAMQIILIDTGFAEADMRATLDDLVANTR
jgi:thiol-disulfide isomerase/thioredoxin